MITVMLVLMAGAGVRAQNFPVSDTVTEYSMKATYYADKFVGRKTSSGEVFSQEKYTAAHHRIKMGTFVLVTNKKTGEQVVVKVNDRCPIKGVIDLTKKAARSISVKGTGSVSVRVLPSSYKYYWEHQDEIRSMEDRRQFLVEDESRLMEGVEHTKKKSKWVDIKEPQEVEEQAVEEEVEDAMNVPVATEEVDKNGLFNIVLCTVPTRKEVSAQVDLLPVHYKENVEERVDVYTGGVELVLNLSIKYDKAEVVKKTLETTFPNCKIEAAK